MSQPSFRDATDALCLSAAELGELFDTSVQHIRQMRMDPAKPGIRPPPIGWERVLEQVARERAKALLTLAEDLAG